MEWLALKASRWFVIARRVGLWAVGFAVAVGLLILVDCLFWSWLPTDTEGFVTSKDRWDLRMKALGGLLVAAGFVLTAWRIKVSNKQAEAALRQAENAAEQARTAAKQAETSARQVAAVEDGQVTERFTRAVEQLARVYRVRSGKY